MKKTMKNMTMISTLLFSSIPQSSMKTIYSGSTSSLRERVSSVSHRGMTGVRQSQTKILLDFSALADFS